MRVRKCATFPVDLFSRAVLRARGFRSVGRFEHYKFCITKHNEFFRYPLIDHAKCFSCLHESHHAKLLVSYAYVNDRSTTQLRQLERECVSAGIANNLQVSSCGWCTPENSMYKVIFSDSEISSAMRKAVQLYRFDDREYV